MGIVSARTITSVAAAAATTTPRTVAATAPLMVIAVAPQIADVMVTEAGLMAPLQLLEAHFPVVVFWAEAAVVAVTLGAHQGRVRQRRPCPLLAQWVGHGVKAPDRLKSQHECIGVERAKRLVAGWRGGAAVSSSETIAPV